MEVNRRTCGNCTSQALEQVFDTPSKEKRTGMIQPVIYGLKGLRGGYTISDCPLTSIKSIILTINAIKIVLSRAAWVISIEQY